MTVPTSTMSRLHVGVVDEQELLFLVGSTIGGGVLHYSETSDVFYGAGSEGDFKLKVRHDSVTGAIVAIEPGPSLTPDLLDKLEKRIETDLLDGVGDKIGRDVLLAESPIDGYFRYRDEFQIVPLPRYAPRVVWAPGKSARHPLILEVRIGASRNHAINIFRKAKITWSGV